MQFFILIFCAVATLRTFVGETNAHVLPTYVYNKAGNYYYYKASMEPSKYNAKLLYLNSFRGMIKREPYQRYTACVARTFSIKDCTLCFCTDIPNIALCWDYKGEKCKQTQKFVLEQKNASNNDPTGV